MAQQRVNPKNSKPVKRKKKLSKKARRKRRIRIAIVFSPVVIVVVLVAFLISSVTVFRVQSFDLKGSSRYTAEEIINASGVEKGDSLIWAKSKKGEESILQKLPYISSVTIKKRLPNTLSIEYKESEQLYGINIGGTWVLTDTKFKAVDICGTNAPEGVALRITFPENMAYELGKVISTKEQETQTKEDAEEITTQSDFVDVYEIYAQLSSAISGSALEGKITAMDISSLTSYSIEYDGRITIKLGSLSGIADKLKLAAGAIANEENSFPDGYGTLDVSTRGQAYFRPTDKKDADTTEKADASAADVPENIVE